MRAGIMKPRVGDTITMTDIVFGAHAAAIANSRAIADTYSAGCNVIERDDCMMPGSATDLPVLPSEKSGMAFCPYLSDILQ
jgi:hypothetical protein